MAESDPTKEPEFQKVVQHFLRTPPTPHKPAKRRKALVKTARKPKRKS